MESCTGCGDTKDPAAGGSGNVDFEQTKDMADSLYNCMQFRDAYDLYLQLLDNEEVNADSEKRMSVLNCLCTASKLSGHKAEVLSPITPAKIIRLPEAVAVCSMPMAQRLPLPA